MTSYYKNIAFENRILSSPMRVRSITGSADMIEVQADEACSDGLTGSWPEGVAERRSLAARRSPPPHQPSRRLPLKVIGISWERGRPARILSRQRFRPASGPRVQTGNMVYTLPR